MAVDRLEDPSESEREAAIAALTTAFVRDPVMRWMYPRPSDYLAHFPPFAAAFGGPAFAAGTAWMDGEAGGAALWLPPGTHPDGDAIGATIVAGLEEARQEPIFAVLSQMDRYHPEEPHWYLAIIGVDAAHQGQGLGAQLMEPALARCDEDGLIAYLESSNPANISLYQRHGFEIMGEIREGDSPVVTPMLRPARKG